MSGNTNEPIFGPGHNAVMDLNKTIKITVPAHWRASFTFCSESAYDNAIVITTATRSESEVGFEDWTDMDFNDIAFRVKVHK